MLNLKNIRRKLYQYIVDELGLRIVRGVYPPGSTLPNEDALCSELGVSRGVLREATKVLIQKGMIESRTRTGTAVCPHENWNIFDPDVLTWKLQNENRAEFLRNIMEVRRIIESEAAKMAAGRASEEDIARIRSVHDEMARSVSEATEETSDKIKLLDLKFHAGIMEASGNELIAQIGHTMRQALLTARQIDQPDLEAHKASISYHQKILNAIAERDAEKASLLSIKHVDYVWQELQSKKTT